MNQNYERFLHGSDSHKSDPKNTINCISIGFFCINKNCQTQSFLDQIKAVVTEEFDCEWRKKPKIKPRTMNAIILILMQITNSLSF